MLNTEQKRKNEFHLSDEKVFPSSLFLFQKYVPGRKQSVPSERPRMRLERDKFVLSFKAGRRANKNVCAAPKQITLRESVTFSRENLLKISMVDIYQQVFDRSNICFLHATTS